jgi:uncharacterized NAD(P)/FAD-binding protein YdhS
MVGAALVAAAAGTGATAQGVATKPALRIASTSPIVVRGTHFRALERVRVTLAGDAGRQSQTTRASRVGAFVVRFASNLPFDPCTGTLTVRALGTAGDKASATVGQRECPPP